MSPIRPATLSDSDAIQTLAVDTKMFQPEEASFLGEMLAGALDGSMEGSHWLVYEVDVDGIIGAAYYAPEPFADRVWNLYFISVSPKAQGRGVGGALMRHIEAALTAMGPERARVVIVETSSTAQYARTREFYPKQGYVEEARVREFYGPGDDKVVFWKSLVGG